MKKFLLLLAFIVLPGILVGCLESSSPMAPNQSTSTVMLVASQQPVAMTSSPAVEQHADKAGGANQIEHGRKEGDKSGEHKDKDRGDDRDGKDRGDHHDGKDRGDDHDGKDRGDHHDGKDRGDNGDHGDDGKDHGDNGKDHGDGGKD